MRVKPLLLSQRQESLSVLASAVQDFSNPSRQMENLKASTRLRLFFSMNLLQLTFTTTDDPPSIRLPGLVAFEWILVERRRRRARLCGR